MTAPATAELATALPQYRVGARIGAGGMGVVYAAVHRGLGRQVAIKQLPCGRADDAGMAARFEHEARLLAGLDHPHIVPVYDYLPAETGHLLVMEKLDGGSVWSRLHGDGLTGEQSCAIGLAMLAGLDAAHRAGVLHLDVKPKNLLFTAGGVLKVADFGIAQVVSEGATLVTRAGEMLGTPAYIAPEQALGNPLTPAADLYAAGTVLYELLSGVLPYTTDGGAIALLHQHVYTDPRPITGVPPALAGVVMRSLVRDPARRYRDAEAFAMDLASAASLAYGIGWLERAAVPVHLSPRVASCATSGPSRPTVPACTVRARVPDPPNTMTLADLGTLVPAREVLRPPRSARWPAFGALVAAAGLAALAAVVPPSAADPARPPTLDLSVNSAPAGGGSRLDLTSEVRLAGVPVGLDEPAGQNEPAAGVPGAAGAPGSAGAAEAPGSAGAGGAAAAAEAPVARLRLSAAGVPLGEVTSGPLEFGDGRWQASVEPPAMARWLAGGAVTGEVVLERSGAAVATEAFTVRPAQFPLLSAMGAGSVLLLMFTLAYLESIMRSVRRRRLRRSGPLLAAPVGAVFGVAAGVLGFVLSRAELQPGVLLACSALGAVAAVLATLARSRSARSTPSTPSAPAGSAPAPSAPAWPPAQATPAWPPV